MRLDPVPVWRYTVDDKTLALQWMKLMRCVFTVFTVYVDKNSRNSNRLMFHIYTCTLTQYTFLSVLWLSFHFSP